MPPLRKRPTQNTEESQMKQRKGLKVDIYSYVHKDERGQLTNREPWFWNWHLSEWAIEQIKKGKT